MVSLPDGSYLLSPKEGTGRSMQRGENRVCDCRRDRMIARIARGQTPRPLAARHRNMKTCLAVVKSIAARALLEDWLWS